jgi:hypothetical protein
MRCKTAVIVALTLVAATTSLAGVDEMALSREGTLYRLVHMDDRLVLLIDNPAGSPEAQGPSNLPSSVNAVPVPQTTGVFPSNLGLDYDHRSGTAVAVWQESVDSQTARVMLAAYQAGTWFGPLAVAGDDGLAATSPALLVHEYSTVDEFENEIITSYIHLAWWREGANGGYAEYAGIPLDEDGTLVLEETVTEPLRGLFPFGISCSLLNEHSATLAHPKFFVDPQTGDPHLLYADLEDCLFGILHLDGELPPLVENGDDVPVDPKRRRHVVVFGVREEIAIKPDMPLEETQFEVGYDLSVVAYWDKDEALQYVILDDEGWSEIRALPEDSGLTHEQAVAMIRTLAR